MSAPGGGGAYSSVSSRSTGRYTKSGFSDFPRIECYSFSLTTFSPSGKLVQIEHALAAVSGGQTSLGIKGQC